MSAPNEVEATITRLSSHRGVKGVLILSSESGKVIRFTGPMLEDPSSATVNGDTTDGPASQDSTNGDATRSVMISGPVKRYADMVRRIVENSRQGVEEVDEQVSRRKRNGEAVILMKPHRTRSNSCGYEQRSTR